MVARFDAKIQVILVLHMRSQSLFVLLHCQGAADIPKLSIESFYISSVLYLSTVWVQLTDNAFESLNVVLMSHAAQHDATFSQSRNITQLTPKVTGSLLLYFRCPFSYSVTV